MRERDKWIGCRKTGLIQILCIVFIIVGLVIPSHALSEGWGQIMAAVGKTKIRAERTVSSRPKGSLETGQKVRADFLKNNWYAIFPPDQQERIEAGALGYVHVTRLKNIDDRPAAKTTGEMITVKGIRVIPGPGDVQTVFIALSGHAEPSVIPLQGENERLVIDFSNVSSVEKRLENMEVGGKLIRRIRSHLDPKKDTFRVVLDLNNGEDYIFSQKFYESEKLYTLKLSDNKNAKVR